MKTATIFMFLPYGTSEVFANICYRGRLLKSFSKTNVHASQANSTGIPAAAKEWAISQGFTRVKFKGYY